MNNFCAAVLCGGKGTRLKAVVPDRPKPMADVGGRPFLERVLEYLEKNGASRIILLSGYMSGYIREYFIKRKSRAEILFSEEKEPLGTAGAVRLAAALFNSDPFFVLNGDSLCDTNLKPVIDFHLSRGADATVILSKMDDIRDYGSVELDWNGRIVKFIEKQASVKAGLVNAGTYLLSKKALDSVPDGAKSSLEYDLFPKMNGIYGFVTDKDFIDIGTGDRFKKANKLFGKNT